MKTSYLSKHFLLMAILSLSAAISYAQDQKPEESLNALKDGNKRFCSGQLLHTHQDLSRIDELKTGQKPFAIVVSCSDSRVTPEIVFDQGLGDIFSIRTAGNVMADYEEGSIEYAAEHLGTKLIVVMGHTSCGAVKAFMDIKHSHENHDAHHTGKLGHIESIIKKLDSEEEEDEVFKTEGDVYNRAIIANVIHGVKQLRKSEPFLKEMHEDGDVQIVGAIYHIESGEVEFLDI